MSALKKLLELANFEGESSRISQEDKPDVVVEIMENLRPTNKIGDATKRNPYTNKITSGLTSLKTMKEFEDINGGVNLAVIDDNALEVKTNTSGTYSAGSFTDNNDGTIDGDNTHLITFNNELRGGVGTRTATTGDKPLWFGYIKDRKRYNDAVTITDGLYLEEQINWWPIVFTISAYSTPASHTGTGLEAGTYYIYLCPVYDNYQKSFPFYAKTVVVADNDVIKFYFTNAGQTVKPRITAYNIFISSKLDSNTLPDPLTTPAYFLEKVDMNSNGYPVLQMTGILQTVVSPNVPTYVEFDDDFANWETFELTGLLCDFDASTSYTGKVLGARTVNTTKVRYALSGLVYGDSGDAVTLTIYPGWYIDTNYYRYIVYDNYYKKLTTEMYTYLNCPTGTVGIGATKYIASANAAYIYFEYYFKYKYIAWNGVQAIYSGLSTDTGLSYFSVINAPDVVPETNVQRHRGTVVGLNNVGQDFIVYTKVGIERMRVGGSEPYIDRDYSNAVLVNNKSQIKLTDDMLLIMTYAGPALIQGYDISLDVGQHLREWWLETFTKVHLEGCVMGYNYKEEEVWISFPTYDDETYGNGIIFVFDFKAFKLGYKSPWWRVKTDIPVYAFDTNFQFNLIAGSRTKVVDFNTSGSELLSTTMKLKLVDNPLISRKNHYDRVYVQKETDDVITINCYFDGESIPTLGLTLDNDETAFIKYVAKKLEMKLTTPSSNNDLSYKRILLTGKSLR